MVFIFKMVIKKACHQPGGCINPVQKHIANKHNCSGKAQIPTYNLHTKNEYDWQKCEENRKVDKSILVAPLTTLMLIIASHKDLQAIKIG